MSTTEQTQATNEAAMSDYERQVWSALLEHWAKRANKRGLPNWAGNAVDKIGGVARDVSERVAKAVPDVVADPIRNGAEFVADKTVEPVIASAAALLRLVDDWAAELTDPASVEKLARKNGVALGSFSDLRASDLKACDRLLGRNSLTWRSAGAIEGAAMGAVALIPVPVAGVALSITADVLVVQVLSVSIASRIAYSYGFDAKDPLEEAFIQRLVHRSFIAQAAKAKPIADTAKAARAIHGRVRWSDKLLQDHRIVGALKALMERVGGAGSRVPVTQVAKAVPFVSNVVGAGVNSAALGSVAEDAKRFCQTRFLCEKYGLPMPAALTAMDASESEQ